MSKVYDTSFLRRIAASILDSSDNISLISKRFLLPIETDIPQQLDGYAAEAMEAVVGEVEAEIISCKKGVSNIGTWLNHYANQLDEADEKAVQLFQER